MSNSWIGVDLDGTFAHYDGYKGPEHIGEPVPEMLERVKQWRKNGVRVKIFTARACVPDHVKYVEEYILKHVGEKLEVTNIKDYHMVELWDDRAVRVVFNTGKSCCSNHELLPVRKNSSSSIIYIPTKK